MLNGYRESNNAHDATILATQFYVENEFEEEIVIFDIGEGILHYIAINSFQRVSKSLLIKGFGAFLMSSNVKQYHLF